MARFEFSQTDDGCSADGGSKLTSVEISFRGLGPMMLERLFRSKRANVTMAITDDIGKSVFPLSTSSMLKML